MSQIQATPQAARFTRSHKRPRFPTAHKPAPSLGGSGAGLLEACLHPQPEFKLFTAAFLTTGARVSIDSGADYFDTWYEVGCLDAPLEIAKGSVFAFPLANTLYGMSSVTRAGTYA